MKTEIEIKQAIEQLQLDIKHFEELHPLKYRKDDEKKWLVFKQDVIRTLKWVLDLEVKENEN